MQLFSGKVVVITGGGRGIGQAAALEVGALGATVAIVDRKSELAEETAALCQSKGIAAHAFNCDQGDSAAVEQCISAISARLGSIDGLFANAGTGKFAPLVDMNKDDWDTMMKVNLNGTFYVCQEVARQMIRQGRGGKIVISASSGARVISDKLGAYCVSKAGTVMLMKHLASELGNHRINVNAILPGVVETGMTAAMLSDERLKRMLVRQTPLGRWGQPAEIGKLVAFLLSDDASYINGEDIMIDGGSTLHGAPRWASLDYTQANSCDWDALYEEYPYRA